MKTLYSILNYHEKDFPVRILKCEKGYEKLSVEHLKDLIIRYISNRSTSIRQNTLFIAIPGNQYDGHKYIPEAIKKGAKVICCENMPETRDPEVTYIQVKNTRIAWAWVAERWHEYPSRKLCIVGITGTNGKTTISSLLYQLFLKLGHPSGWISTISYEANGKSLWEPPKHTTPDPFVLSNLLSQMVKKGCTHCFMEVSSHALAQHRVKAIPFHVAVLSNISQDHLDYHKTFQNYIKTKKKLFDQLPQKAYAIVNADDLKHSYMLQNTKAKILKYSLKSPSNYQIRLLENTPQGLSLEKKPHQASFMLRGEFNAYNIAATLAVACQAFQNSEEKVLTLLSKLKPVQGRLEYIPNSEGLQIVVDFAHTPHALKQVLQTLSAFQKNKDHKLILVLGCGGERDREKRSIMGKIACQYENIKAFFTSDNPRNEDPREIIQDMMSDLNTQEKKKVRIEPDRQKAIRKSLNIASKGDTLLVAGKGHEMYQEIKGVKYPFSDKKIIQNILFKKSKRSRRK
ncbi:MAG: UDP-N-acetylmuramoyl-L-alanyl-D-glutamate--2,6-diaminopimelate ligase [Cytophagales bacterium]|nr:UDP-N-acetylmuramoyl-L-alanyl-D-glutamate--2,6-diaminopimelate ligase [Cytophagales bacterium]